MAANKATLDLSVAGMTCGSCVRHVTQALLGVDGVTEARVDLQGRSARVMYDPTSATPERLVSAVQDAGYQAASTSTGRSDALPVQCGCGSACCA